MKKQIAKTLSNSLIISFILVLYRWVCYTSIKRRAFAPLRYSSSLSRINNMIPMIKSVNACRNQVLSDFFFFRLPPLICISPPYNYIIAYGVPYVNSYLKEKLSHQREPSSKEIFIMKLEVNRPPSCNTRQPQECNIKPSAVWPLASVYTITLSFVT